MSYATYESLVSRYAADDIERLSDKKKIGELDLDVVNTALSDATGEINAYLTRYKLPLTAISVELERICCVLARYWLEEGQNTTKAHQDYKECLLKLEDLREGKSKLGLSDDDLLPDHAGDIVIIESDPSVWGRKQSGGFI